MALVPQHGLGMTARVLDFQRHATLGRLVNPFAPGRQHVFIHGVLGRQPRANPHFLGGKRMARQRNRGQCQDHDYKFG